MTRILVVEAALRVRLALHEILARRADWRVLEARDGAAALEVLRGMEPPQLCIFGREAGDGTGADLLRKVRAEAAPLLKRLPIFLTVPEGELAATAAATGLDPLFLLPRPFDPERVLAALDRAAGDRS